MDEKKFARKHNLSRKPDKSGFGHKNSIQILWTSSAVNRTAPLTKLQLQFYEAVLLNSHITNSFSKMFASLLELHFFENFMNTFSFRICVPSSRLWQFLKIYPETVETNTFSSLHALWKSKTFQKNRPRTWSIYYNSFILMCVECE